MNDVGDLARAQSEAHEKPVAEGYSDKSLKDEGVMLVLAAQQFEANMLRGVDRVWSRAGTIVVVKFNYYHRLAVPALCSEWL